MKILILLIALLFSAGPAVAGTTERSDEEVFANADWNWRKIGKAAEVGYAQLPLFNSLQSISVIRYKASVHRTLVINDPEGDAATTSAMAQRHNALAAINGSYFNMKTLEPVTFIKENRVQEGRTTAKESFRVNGVLGIRGRRLEIFLCDTTEYATLTRKYRDVMAAGPVLMMDGAPVANGIPSGSSFLKRHPRTIVGTTPDGWIYLVVIDGRNVSNAAGATLEEAASIAKMFGLEDVINLDGGGSSELWTNSYGVESYPSDNRKFDHEGERIVPNILIIR